MSYGILIHQILWNYIFVLISNLNPCSQGRADTTSMRVKGMMDQRDLILLHHKHHVGNSE